MICVAFSQVLASNNFGFLESGNQYQQKTVTKQSRGLNLDEPPCPTKGIQLVSCWQRWWQRWRFLFFCATRGVINEAAGMIRFLGGWFRESPPPKKKDALKIFQVKY